MKIVSSGKGIHSPQFLKKKQRNKRIRRIAAIVGVILVIAFIIYLFNHEKFRINKVVIIGAGAVSPGSMGDITRELIDGSYLWIFPRSNILLYPKSLIATVLLSEFPRLETLDVDLEGFNTLNITVAEREPKVLYCAAECYFVDDKGLIFDKAPSFSGDTYLEYSLAKPIANPIGKYFLDTDDFVALSKFVKALEDLDIHATKVLINEFEFEVVLPGAGKIAWLRDSNLDLVYSNLEAFLASQAIKSQRNFLERISQLDLRTANKIFYKFKGE